jgi:hypothetical protein
MGHPLRDDQQLFIVAIDAACSPTAERQAAWRDLQSILAESHENLRQSGVAHDELNRAIDEACEEVRYGT